MNQLMGNRVLHDSNEDLMTALEKRISSYVVEAEKLRNEYYFDTKRTRRALANKKELGSLGLSIRKIKGRENAIQIVWIRFKLMPATTRKKTSTLPIDTASNRKSVDLPMSAWGQQNGKRDGAKATAFSVSIKKGSGGKSFRYKSSPIKKFATDWEFELFNHYEDRFAIIRKGMKFCRDGIRYLQRLNDDQMALSLTNTMELTNE